MGSEIQQEEEAVRNKEDHMCRIDGNQWFVQQRERAASIGEIQEREKQERERLDLIAEQRQIEEEIRMRRSKKRMQKRRKGRSTTGEKRSQRNLLATSPKRIRRL